MFDNDYPLYNPEPSDDTAYEDRQLAEYLSDCPPSDDIDWDWLPADIDSPADPIEF